MDAGTVEELRRYRAARGRITLDLVLDSALVLGGLVGRHRHPERFSRRFTEQVAQACRSLGEDTLPAICLHDLRHTHATLLVAAEGAGQGGFRAAEPRLATISLQVYAHVQRGMGRQVAGRFPGLWRMTMVNVHALIARVVSDGSFPLTQISEDRRQIATRGHELPAVAQEWLRATGRLLNEYDHSGRVHSMENAQRRASDTTGVSRGDFEGEKR